METIKLKRVNGDFGFEAIDADNHTVKIDTKNELGGTNFGVRPMQLLLMGLASCSGMDIVSILKKQRQEIKDFDITIHAEREEKGDVKLWKKIELEFILSGNIDKEKAKKACDLSIQKYCSVAATLRLANCEIEYSVRLK